MRRLVSNANPLEQTIGFSRAVRVGNQVFVTATAPVGADGKTVGVGDVTAQARQALAIIADALREAGASLADVVRSRVFLKDMNDWQAAAAVHGKVFADIRPACFFVQVGRFIDPDWLIEIEVDAVIDSDKD